MDHTTLNQWVNTWLHNVYGLTDDSLLNAGDVEELCRMIVRDFDKEADAP